MADKTRCVVTGLGLVCGLGNNVDDCWKAAVDGITGIKDVKSVDTSNCYSHKGAEASLSDSELSDENYDRSSLLCIKAAKEALDDAKLNLNNEDCDRIGVILGSCVGGAASIDKYYTDKFKNGSADKADILKMPASAIASNVAKHFDLNGITANIVNACAAGTLSLSYACDLIRSGKADAFVAGGSDSFSSLAFAGFHALHALAEQECSPFNHSNGITLGEGSGVLIIESYEHAVKRKAKIYCEILGSGVSSDAHHITAPRPDGEGQMSAIKRAVKNSAINFSDIDYINAHGTGTAKNDEAEFLSLRTLFDGNNHLSVSSTKSMTGHCLGAAGSIEAVLTVKAVCDSEIPPTIGYSDADLEALREKGGELDFIPNKKREKDVAFAMSNSFAFGGNNASIVFAKESHNILEKKNNQPIYITGISELAGAKSEADKGFRAEITSADFKKHNIKMAFYRKLDRLSQLQLLSGIEALADAGITVDEKNENDIGIIIGTSDGPMTEIVNFQKNVIENGTESGSAFLFPNTVYNAAGGYLSIFAGIKGYNVTVANGFQAGLQSIGYAAGVIRNGEESIMLATGTDENTDVDYELYSQLGILSDNKPYSFDNNGFNLGEGSVSVVLESKESSDNRGSKKYAELAGCSTTRRSVEFGKIRGSEPAMKKAILSACDEAGITADMIDGICGFGNGDKTVDGTEISVYREVFDTSVPVFLVKENSGEARAASAAMQLAYAARILSGEIKNAKAYRVSKDSVSAENTDTKDFKYMLAVSFGAGGTYSAVVLKKA